MTARQSNLILGGIVAAILAAFVCVAVFGESMTAVGWLGTFFLTSLRMVVVPLIICSIIVGISGLGDVRRLGRVGLATLAYYAATTAAAVLLGIILVNIIRPGAGMAVAANEANTVRVLHDLAAAQERLKASLAVDQTQDLQGEYGYLGDVLPWVVAGGPGPLDGAAFAAAGWTQPEPTEPWRWRHKGYEYQAWLPAGAGGASTGVLRAHPRQEHPVRSQNAWAVVARPVEPGVSGEHAFYVNQIGQPYRLPDAWSGVGDGRLFRVGAALPTGIELPAGKRASIDRKRSMGLTDIILSFVSRNIMAAFTEMDVLPIIVFCLLFGGLLTTIGDRGAPVIAFFQGANDAIMKLVYLIMWIAPIGIFGLVAAKFGGATDLGAELGRLGKYITTVLLGLGIHGLVVLPALLWLFTRRNPAVYAAGMGKALLTAFSTASSSSTLPITVECAVDENHISRRSAYFVLPIGATVNMDGTALYESVAAIFIAQAYGISLGFGEQAMIFVTATLAAVGAAGIPEAGLFTMVLVLKAVGLPLEGIALLLVVDWFLDRCRTTINVWGDAVGAAVIDRLPDTGGPFAHSGLDALLPRGSGGSHPTPAPGT